MTLQKPSYRAIAVGILLLAAGIRFISLGNRNLWFDEGVSLTYSQMTLHDVLHFHILWQDTNPPIYRVLLGVWMRPMGVSAFTARALSAFLGLVAVPMTYRIARRVGFSHLTGIIAAFLLAIWPMQVYYSREAKHYTFMQIFLLIAILAWLNLFRSSVLRQTDKRSVLWAAATSVCTFLAVGSQYMSLLMVVAMALWILAKFFDEVPQGQKLHSLVRPTAIWGASIILAGIAVFPWVLATAPSAAAGTQSASANIGLISLTPLTYISQTVLELSAGPIGPNSLRIVMSLIVISLATVGVAWIPRASNSRWLLIVWLLVPILLGMVVQTIIPFFYPRFLLFVTPALAILEGQGISCLGSTRKAKAGMLAAVVGSLGMMILSGFLISAQQAMPERQPDLRPVAESLQRQIKPGDALIYSYSWQPGMLAAYLPDSAHPTYYPSFFEQGRVGESLRSILDQHKRVWLLTYTIGANDPINDVGLWLLGHAASPGGVWYQDSQLTLFISPDKVVNPGSPNTCIKMGQGRIELCYARFEARLVGGESAPIALYWKASTKLVERYIIFVHALAENSAVPVAQQDNEPVNGLAPTFSWEPGHRITDLHAIIPPAPALGQSTSYHIVVGLYDADTQQRVPVDAGGDSVDIGELTVSNP